MNILRLGCSDSEVEQLHDLLKHPEFDVSIVDDRFGQRTQLAIE